MKQQSVAVASAVGPSRGLQSTSTHKNGTKNASTGIGGLPGGVVGPEAAGLDPSGPEHFFVTLAAYADALDALPLDLTRSFSDLRELDAVLGSHLNSLTARLNHLTALIEDPDVGQGQRLLALKEVAEEARAYKMGGEDKIRVALNTAETIISHTDYIDALDAQLDRFPEISALLNPTKHLKLDQYYVPGSLKDRKLITSLDSHAGAIGSSGAADVNGAGGSKKKKVGTHVAAASAAGGKSHKASDTASVAGSTAGGASSNSKKRKAISGAAVGGSSTSAGSKVAKSSGSGKGDEDVKSAANGASTHKKKTDGSSHAAGSGSKSSSHAANSNTRLPRAAHAHGIYTEDDEEGPNGRKDGASRRGAAGDADESSASRSRNSRAVRTATTTQRSDDDDEELDDPDADEEEEAMRSSTSKSRSRAGRSGAANSSTSRARGGAASAAANSPHTGSTSASRADSPASAADGGDDADEARYCFCNNVSYGDMIGCDDDDCEREWFHLGCVGLTKPPQGTWYCEACLERRAANGRGGKSKKAKNGGGSKSKIRR